MAKLDIASVYGTEDWGFEPLWTHQKRVTPMRKYKVLIFKKLKFEIK